MRKYVYDALLLAYVVPFPPTSELEEQKHCEPVTPDAGSAQVGSA